MICYACKKDKDTSLFTPYAVLAKNESNRICRKCLSERQGHEFGKITKGGTTTGYKLVAYERVVDKLENAKKAAKQEDIKRLLELRKKRLEDK
jgi:hypothetical protein